MPLVLFPQPSSLQPSCKCRCSPHKIQIHTHKYQLRAQNTHILLFARYTFPNTKYTRHTCLVPVQMQLQTFPPRLDLPHVWLSNVSALSPLQRFLRLFKTGSLQFPSLVGEHNFATKVFGLRSERVKVGELFHQQSAERRPFLER